MAYENRYGFMNTRWTLLARARSDPGARSELLGLYYEPIRRFFMGISRGRRQDAEDMVQEFLQREWEYKDDLVRGRDSLRGVINRADPTQGSFRAYLLQAMRWFALSRLTKTTGAVPGAHCVSMEDDSVDTERSVAAATASIDELLENASQAFSEAWVLVRFAEAVRRVERYCASRGRSQHAVFFREHYLPEPGVDNSWEAIAARYTTPTHPLDGRKVRSLAVTAERRFKQALLDIVKQDIQDAQPSQELRELCAYLGA